jgi:putative ABC transport system permease protein
MAARLLAKSSLRFYRRHPWQLVLAVAGIALGVAVFVGIQLANDSARRAFEISSAAVRGQTTHRLLPLAASLPESTYLALKRDRRFVASAPVLEAAATILLADGRRIELALEGIDPIEELEVRALGELAGDGVDPTRLLSEPGTVLIPDAIANRFDLTRGDELALVIGSRTERVEVAGTLPVRADGSTRILTDIATAQELTGEIGRLSRIDLRLEADAAAELAEALPADSVLVPAGGQDQALRELTRAFNTNLTALGLLALVVGMFLIYSTISFNIVQRWRSIAVLRALGLDRRELMLKLLGEALLIGVAGTALGLALGNALSSGLLELVLRTLDDLYFRRALGAAESSSWIFVYSAALGVGATLASALVPALAAARREITSATRSRTERSAAHLARVFAWAAIPTFALAGLVLWLDPRGLWPAFAALFLVLIAGAMLVPLATHGLMRVVEAPLAALTGLPGRMAARGVTDSLSRTGVATAALTVAVATVMSIGLMIASFRLSLIEWIDTTVTADLYVDIGSEGTAALAPGLTALEALPEVTGLSRVRSIRLATAVGELSLRAASPGPAGYGIDITEPAGASAAALLAGDAVVLAAEPLAYRLDLAAGGALELPTPSGRTDFTVAGIYRDYNTAGTELIMALDTYRRHFADNTLTSIGVHLAPGADEAAVTAAIRRLLGDPRARVRSTSQIREISLVIFDRTFQVTEVLRLLAAIVAFLGILSAVMALQLEREREFAVLRSLGMSIRELFGQNLAQTALIGLTAGLAAMPLGAALAWMLVHVINRRSFGWSMDFVISPAAMLAGLAMAIAAAVLAGLYPALVGARADMGLAWRDD